MRHQPRAGRLITLTVLLLTPAVATVTTAPAPAAASTTVTPMVASSGAHTCELVPDGTVRCWGANNRGQLGDGTTTDRSHPVAVVLPGGAPLTHVVAITVGSDHTCALLGADADLPGSVRCWGMNHRGQLGDGTTTQRSTPVTVLTDGTEGSSDEAPLIAVAAVSAGGAHTCALLTNHQVHCWGNNNHGQLGRGGVPTTDPNTHPARVDLPGGRDATRITAGFDHSCATVTTTSGDDELYCWGSNEYGQLGHGSYDTESADPVLVGIGGTASGGTITSITAGTFFTCATVTVGGTTTGRCWGDNSFGQLGDGTTTQRSTPVTVLADGGAALEVSAISAGSGHTCALAAGGAVLCWGTNNFGQLGNGTATGSTSPIPSNPTPTPVRLTGTSGATLTGITSIAPGNQHTCALAAGSSGTTSRRCWGRNDVGQLGAGTITAVEFNPVSVLLTVPDRAGILALDAPSCTAVFATVDGPFAELATPSAFDVEVTFDRPALVTWVTALTASGTGGPLETLWGIDPAEDLTLVETALAWRPVSATAADGGTGTSGAAVPTVAVAGTEMHDLTRTLFGPEATAFDLAVDETVTTRYRLVSGTIDDYPTRFDDSFRLSPDGRSFTETQLTTPLDDWGLAPVDTATPFRPEVVLSLRLATGNRTADEQMVVVLPCGGPATVAPTSPVTPPAITPDEPEGTDADEPADDAPAPRAVACSNVSVGVMSCGLTGGEPFETVSWQAAFNPVFASGTLQLDENGAGTLTFDIPDEANGRPVLVTIDGWDVSTTTVASVPIPDSIPAGEGHGTAAFLFWWFLALLAGGVLSLRRVVFRRVG